MNINYKNKSDIVYKAEQYRYRYQGHQTANIEILKMIGEQKNNTYAYHISIKDKSVPKQYREINSSDMFLFKNINPNLKCKATYYNKNECLQNAVDWIAYIMEHHSDKEIIEWDKKTE